MSGLSIRHQAGGDRICHPLVDLAVGHCVAGHCHSSNPDGGAKGMASMIATSCNSIFARLLFQVAKGDNRGCDGQRRRANHTGLPLIVALVSSIS